MPAIYATGLTKSFKGVRAVDGIDLTVDEGECVGVLGPNGAGKTTTLMMLLGIVAPDAGEVRLLGHPLPRERSEALAQVNFTASYLGMPDRLTVRELLDVYADLYGAPRQRIGQVMERFGIEALAKKFCTHLSSGQRTLVGLARAFLNRARLLILDEPTAALDPEIAGRIRAILSEERARDGFTLLITSHNMADIERLADRIVFLARGRVLADASPPSLRARYGAGDLEQMFLTIAAEVRGAAVGELAGVMR